MKSLKFFGKSAYILFLVFGYILNLVSVVKGLILISAQYSDITVFFIYMNLLGVFIFSYSIRREIKKYLESKNIGEKL